MDEITTAEYKALSAEIATLRTEVRATHDALLAAMPALRKSIEEFCAGLINKAALDIEREFGSCVSFTAGSGARKTLDDDQVKASLASFRTQLSRQADHLTNLQTKVQKLERY